MKSFIWFTVFLVLVSGSIYTQENNNAYTLEQVHTYKNRKGIDTLVSRDIEGFAGVSVVSFVEGCDEITLYDVLQNRLVVLDSAFNIKSSIEYPPTSHVYRFGSYYLSYDQDTGFEICDLDGRSIWKTQLSSSFGQLKDFYLKNGFLFVRDRQGKISSYKIAKNQPSVIMPLDTTRTRELLGSEPQLVNSGLTIDEKDRLFLDGQLVTRDFRTFIEYFRSKNGTLQKSGLALNLQVDANKIWADGIYYLGQDAAGNWYWGDNTGAFVFSRVGVLIDYFIVDWEKYRTGKPLVSANGNLYFLGSSTNQITLTQVVNVWDRSFRAGMVNDDGVRVRSRGTTAAEILFILEKGEQLAVLGQSSEQNTIDGKTSPWFKIQLRNGSQGWVFGAFVDIQN